MSPLQPTGYLFADTLANIVALAVIVFVALCLSVIAEAIYQRRFKG